MRRAVALGLALAIAVGVAGTAGATYAGKNGRISFGIRGPDGSVNIYAVLPDGSDPVQLTHDSGFASCPAYTSDGRRIAYCKGRLGATEIWTMNADGSDQRQLTFTDGNVFFPDFSPDGRRIAFSGAVPSPFEARHERARTRDAQPSDQIYVVDSAGGPVLQLTDSPGGSDYPAFAPDGRTIAFVSRRTGIGQIWLMNADGSNQHPLTFDALGKDQVPDWSPDGRAIAYMAGEDIWVMNADGSNARDLTRSATVETGVAWSPDGSQLAFRRLGSGPPTVWVMNRDGSGQRVLHSLGAQLVPAWQPLP